MGGKHLSLSDDSGTTDGEFLQAATSGLPAAQVDKVTVTTPSGRVTVDFPQRTGTGVTRSDNLAADLLLATTSLMVPLDPNHRDALTRFLRVTGRGPAADVMGTDTHPFDDEDVNDEPSADVEAGDTIGQ